MRTAETDPRNSRIAMIVTPVGRFNGSEMYVSRPPLVKSLCNEGPLIYFPSPAKSSYRKLAFLPVSRLDPFRERITVVNS